MTDKTENSRKSTSRDNLEGQLLLAMPTLKDPNFERSVIFMCAHSDQGAMGLIINQRARDITFPALLDQLDISGGDGIPSEMRHKPVLLGGPVETSRGFVLHSNDYHNEEATLTVDSRLGLTATIEILKDMLAGNGPADTLLALGYSGWSPGQLEREIQANGWLHCTADDELIFHTPLDEKYDRSLARLGIDLSHLSADAGHA